MDITKARQALERHKRVVPDYAKRGYGKRCEDAFADLEKTAASLPADQVEQFRAEVDPFIAATRKQLGLTWIEDAKKNVQRHLKYAEDSMAKGVAKNVVNAKDVIIKTVDKCDGRMYFEYHESGAPFLAEIDAMYQKIDSWLAANDPAAKPTPSPAPVAATPKPATAAPPSTSTSSTPTPGPASVAAPAQTAAAASKPAAAAAPKEPEYRRIDAGAFLPVLDTSPSTGLPKQVLSFLPAMVNSYGKQCNQMYDGIVKFIDKAIPQCSTPFDIERKKHELSGSVPHLLDKIEQLEEIIPKAQAVDEKLARMLESEIAAARAKVKGLVSMFEAKAKAAAPLLEVKTQLKQAELVVEIMNENQNDTGVVQLRELPAYDSSAGVQLRDLWGIVSKILDKAKAAAEKVAELTGKPYDLDKEEPHYNKVLEAAVKAHVNILIAAMKEDMRFQSYGQARAVLDNIKAVLAEHPIEEAEKIVAEVTGKIVEAQDARELKLLEEAKGRQVPRRNWAAGDADAERLEQAALAFLAQNFGARDKPMTPLIARIVGGDWDVIKRNVLDEPIQWNVLMGVIFFEDPDNGFEEPRLRLMYVGPMCREDGSRGLPFVATSVVPSEGEDRFLLQNLPEPFQTEIGPKFKAWEKKP